MLEIMRLIQGLSDSVGAVIAFSIARDCYMEAKLTNLVAIDNYNITNSSNNWYHSH